MLLRKQVTYTGTWSTRIDFEPTNEYEEAGTVAYYSDASYAAIIIKQVGDKRVVIARWTGHESRTVKVTLHSLRGRLELTSGRRLHMTYLRLDRST